MTFKKEIASRLAEIAERKFNDDPYEWTEAEHLEQINAEFADWLVERFGKKYYK